MKKLISMLLVLVFLATLSSSAFADTIKIAVDFDGMSTEELLGLADSLSQVLNERGYTLTIDGGGSGERDAALEMSSDEDAGSTTEEPVSFFVDDTDISDESFLQDMSAALSARWAVSEQDTTTMSDKQVVEYYSMLVNTELAYIGKYSDYDFEDEQLGSYAISYIKGLQSQLIGAEYYGKNDDLLTQYWSTEGYNVRARYIYLINKQYGLTIPSQYSTAFKDMVEVGQLYNYVVPIEAAVSEELRKIELSFDSNGSSQYLYVLPFNITNTSPYEIPGLTITVNFLDENEVVVDSGYLVSYEKVSAGKAISTNKVSTNTHFTHLSYSYSFTIQTANYYHDCNDTVEPLVQYSWDGTVRRNGELEDGQPVLVVESPIARWEMNTSWNKTLYVPVVKFDVRNTGTGEADNIKVHCVFINNDTQQIWDEETVYVVGVSDAPLQAGYSKKAFAYSSVGYSTKVDSPPNLTVDIYINGQLAETLTINS